MNRFRYTRKQRIIQASLAMLLWVGTTAGLLFFGLGGYVVCLGGAVLLGSFFLLRPQPGHQKLDKWSEKLEGKARRLARGRTLESKVTGWLVGICVFTAGIVVPLSAISVWAYQGYLWLRYEVWLTLPIFEILGHAPQTDWLGVNAIISWYYQQNIGAGLLVLMPVFGILGRFLDSDQKDANRRQIKQVEKEKSELYAARQELAKEAKK
jgi:hypothetical protein